MARQKDAEALWTRRIEQFQKSGQSAKHFIEREGISRQAFFAWKKRLGLQTTPRAKAQFVELGPLQSLLGHGLRASTIEIVLHGGAKVLVPADLVAGYLERLFTKGGE